MLSGKAGMLTEPLVVLAANHFCCLLSKESKGMEKFCKEQSAWVNERLFCWKLAWQGVLLIFAFPNAFQNEVMPVKDQQCKDPELTFMKLKHCQDTWICKDKEMKSPKLLLKKRNRFTLTQGKNWRCSGMESLELSCVSRRWCTWPSVYGSEENSLLSCLPFSLVSLLPQPCCKHRPSGLGRSCGFTCDSEDVGNHGCVSQGVTACLQRAHAVSEGALFSSVRNWDFYSLIFVLFACKLIDHSDVTVWIVEAREALARVCCLNTHKFPAA